jgi:hypothetical protein
MAKDADVIAALYEPLEADFLTQRHDVRPLRIPVCAGTQAPVRSNPDKGCLLSIMSTWLASARSL